MIKRVDISKIKEVKHDFHSGAGPSTTTTVGFRINDRDYILGKFYIGPYMGNDCGTALEEAENDIDSIIRLSNTGEVSNE